MRQFLRGHGRAIVITVAVLLVAGTAGIVGIGLHNLTKATATTPPVHGSPTPSSIGFGSISPSDETATASPSPTATPSTTVSSSPLPVQSGNTPLSARGGYQMAYDGAMQTVLLFGGSPHNQAGDAIGDTWTWDASRSRWQQWFPTNSPPARSLGMMAYDDATRQLVLFGGMGAGGGLLGDTWIWDGTNWSEAQPASSPAPRIEAFMQYDDLDGQIVLFGGQGNGYQDDTWLWDGNTWSRDPAGGPLGADAANSSMAYRAGSRSMVFLDTASGPASSHTWTFDGHVWSRQQPTTNPSYRVFESLARDDATGVVVMFGGMSDNRTFLNETWTWDGSTWTQRHPATSPSARSGGGVTIIAYDAARRVVLLYGGTAAGNQPLNDTWLWDGITWRRAA